MFNRKTTFFYSLLIAITSLVVGMVIASRLGLAPESGAQPIAAPSINSAPIDGPLDSRTFRNIAQAASPAVVNIRTESRRSNQNRSEYFGGDDLLERFFGSPQRQREEPREQFAEAAGTGFIIDKSGLILTNNHVVEGATKIEVSLYGEEDGITYEARVVGRDPLTDSALLELLDKPEHELPEVKFGDSSQIQPGDWVMAIGNPFGLAHTVSVGVVSALERPFPVADGRWAQVLQTDAAINPGNSGGPLLNIRGEVVGINTAIYSDARQTGNIGIGFAMPINVVRDLLPQLRTGKISRGRIGISVGPVPVNAVEQLGLTSREGALVATVNPDGPGRKGGLQPGDVIIEFNNKPVKSNNDLVSIVGATKPDTTVPVKVIRDKEAVTLQITVEELSLEEESRQTAQNNEEQEQTSAGFGISLRNITPQISRQLGLSNDVTGAVIVNVVAGSPAARAGISQGDVVLEVNRSPARNSTEVSQALNSVPSGGVAFILILRNGQEIFVTVTKQ